MERVKKRRAMKVALKVVTAYWRNGKKEFLKGFTVSDAFTKAGYGQGALSSLDFWKDGYDYSYLWDQNNHQWRLKDAGNS